LISLCQCDRTRRLNAQNKKGNLAATLTMMGIV
jgi:hypothetical protein